MKKTILSVITVAGLVYGANAQTEKGKIILGGSVGFNSAKVHDASKSDVSFNIMPSAGYFINDNFALGAGIGYKYNKEVSASVRNGSFVVAPFTRYYIGLADHFKFFGQLSIPLAFGTEKAIDSNGDTGAKISSTTSIDINVAPGFAFYPSKRIAIEFSLNGLTYQNFQNKNDATGSKVSTNSIGLDADTFAPKIGVVFHY